jgi:hypothetical protein
MVVVAALFALALGAAATGFPQRSGADAETIDMSGEYDDAPRVELSHRELAESCQDAPRPDCETLITGTCWDGPDGLTQYVCLTTPSGEGWERLAGPYGPKAQPIQASHHGDYLIVGSGLLDRRGQKVATEPLPIGSDWFGSELHRIRSENDGTATIHQLDGTVVESIAAPPDEEVNRWTSWELSRDETKIAVASTMGTSRLWLYDRAARRWTTLVDDPGYTYLPFITDMGFSPDDQHIVTVRISSDDDGSIQPRRFDVITVAVDDGSVETLGTALTNTAVYSSVSPDGKLVALYNGTGHTRILNLESLEVSDPVVMCCSDEGLRWTPNGSFLVSGSGDVLEVEASATPTINGPFVVSPPDPQNVNLPIVRPQASD